MSALPLYLDAVSTDVDPIVKLESFRALKLSRSESFRALKSIGQIGGV